MIILCCGDRNWNDKEFIKKILQSFPSCTEVIHGDCIGADELSGEAATELGIKVTPVPPKWNIYGVAAGPIRNGEMLKLNPDLVLAFHDDFEHSKGTADMVRQALLAKVRVIHVMHEES